MKDLRERIRARETVTYSQVRPKLKPSIVVESPLREKKNSQVQATPNHKSKKSKSKIQKDSKKNQKAKPQNIFTRRKKSLVNSSSLLKNSKDVQPVQKIIKEKSILPSESYVRTIGFGNSNMSPTLEENIKPRVKVNSTILGESDYYDVNDDENSFRKKRLKGRNRRTRSTRKTIKESTTPTVNNDQEEAPVEKNPVTLRSQLQEKYKRNNAMSHTPNPKVKKEYNEELYLRRSKTPDPKSQYQIVNGPKLFLEEPIKDRKYCLVLDLDETLIHFKNDNGKAKFLIRPHTYKFLKNLHPFFEIIIFTAAQQEYADWIINKIDTKVKSIPNIKRTHSKNFSLNNPQN